MTRDALVALLHRTIEALEDDDSFQGHIEYSARTDGLFDVNAGVRIGNSQGQGGMILVQEWQEQEPAHE